MVNRNKGSNIEKKDERKLKRTTGASIALIGILLAAGILFTILVLNSTVDGIASAKSDASNSADQAVKGAPDAHKPKDTKTELKDSNPKVKTLTNIMTRQQMKELRKIAAESRAKRMRDAGMTISSAALVADPVTGLLIPDQFGPYPNYANSPLPVLSTTGTVITGTGIRKFVDSLPGLTQANANTLTQSNGLGQYIPLAINDSVTYPGSNYYEIGLIQYTEQLHRDIPATTLRGYVQLSTAKVPGKHIPLNYPNGAPILNASGGQVYAVDYPQYLGPIIVAQRNVPVRVKFTNYLPTTTAGGNLFIPVDTTIMGAGMFNINWDPATKLPRPTLTGNFAQNRATLHLHGGNTPWISDGTQHQWTTPAGEVTSYPEGVSVKNVPDMDGGAEPQGTLTFYYTNQQSARLMFYHDHAYGITRLNVYAGEAAGYLETDPVEQGLIASGVLPDIGIPLVIQDKTFVPDTAQLAATDPTWDTAKWGGKGNLWFPHVYMPNQNPYDLTGANAMGRWDYGPWFWPPILPPFIENGPIPNPYCLPTPGVDCSAAPWEPPFMPGTPDARGISPTAVPEAFMDTPVVNGAAYPYLNVEPKAYRFRILNAGNDRMLNLQLYQASNIVGSITLTGVGSGYTSAPVVTITNALTDTTGHGATAAATIDTNISSPTFGQVTGITILTVGSNYTVAPIVTIAPPTTGTQATATAAFYSSPTEVGMVPAVPAGCGNAWPAGWPMPDGRDGGFPDPATVGPSMVQIGTEGGFLPAPYVVPNRPVGYEYNRRSITVLNVQEKALFLGPAERADVVVDFSAFAGKTLVLYNDAPAPVPAFDPRLDYFTADPDNTATGGAPSTLPGYGPNTRTVMQIRVGTTCTGPCTGLSPALATALPQAYNQSQDKPIVGQADYNAALGTAYPADVSQYVPIQKHNVTFTPGDMPPNTKVTMELEPKAIIEDFEYGYGRMNAMLGVEVPLTGPQIQTTLPYFDVDPPTEIIRNSNPATLIGTLSDGTQIWKVTHNGVDTHAIHTHMFLMQLVNRVGWDGAIKPPAPNELGGKDTILMNPLEDIIVALRPIIPNVPFSLPNEIRPLDVTAQVGTSVPQLQFHDVDPNNEPAPVINEMTNYGWEYVWHCHLLGHEENIMMRPVIIAVAPNAPSNLAATMSGSSVTLTWKDNSTNEINWTVQRSSDGNTWTTIANVTSGTGPTNGTTAPPYTDTTATAPPYNYRVLATNIVGYTRTYPAAAGYPTMTANSLPSNIVGVGLPASPTGGLSVTIIPSSTTVSTATAPAVINYTVRIASTENFADIIRVNVSMSGLPAGYQMPLGWFNWTEKTVKINAGGTALIGLKLTIPQGTPGPTKAFRVMAQSTLWTPSRAQGTGVITITP